MFELRREKRLANFHTLFGRKRAPASRTAAARRICKDASGGQTTGQTGHSAVVVAREAAGGRLLDHAAAGGSRLSRRANAV